MRLAFILPRYGPDVLGGAETLVRNVLQHLAQHRHEIEVWTTCARNGWTNEYPAGIEQADGITVHRFPVRPGRPFDIFADGLSCKSQYRWVNHQAHSPALYRHIEERGPAFDFLIFAPYMVGMTLYGATIHPHKTIVWPCLHDELYAYLTPTRRILSEAAGIVFNTTAEHELMVNKLYINHPRTVVAGMGFEILPGDGAAFRRRYPHISEPFFIYAGRLEPAKNVALLFQYFKDFYNRHNGQLKLVMLGDGPLAGKMQHPGLIQLGFVDEAIKRDALATALFLCQPSLNESFSIVLMESWLQGRPVLVHEHCPVTIDHVRQAQGGLYFANYSDFEGATAYFLAHPQQANQMGLNGRQYVQQTYNWPVIIKRLEHTLLNWLAQLK